MIVFLTPTTSVVSASGGKGNPPVVALRSQTPLTIERGNDDEQAESKRLASGLFEVKLTARQSEAFNALSGADLATMVEDGRLILPDSHRGRTAAVGVSLATIIATRANAEADTEAGPEASPEAGPEADTEAPKGKGKG